MQRSSKGKCLTPNWSCLTRMQRSSIGSCLTPVHNFFKFQFPRKNSPHHIMCTSQINQNHSWMEKVQIPFNLNYCWFLLYFHVHYKSTNLNQATSIMLWGLCKTFHFQDCHLLLLSLKGSISKFTANKTKSILAVFLLFLFLCFYTQSHSLATLTTLANFPRKFKGCDKSTMRIASYRPLSKLLGLCCLI